jgi:hypothetical protein
MGGDSNKAASLSGQLQAIAEAETDDFLELVKLARLDPKRDFIGADLRGMNLRNLDLREFDFRGANFRGATIDGTRFGLGLTEHAVFDDRPSGASLPNTVWISGGKEHATDEARSEKARELMQDAANASRQESRIAALQELIATFPKLQGLEGFLKSRAIQDAAKRPRILAERALKQLFRYGPEAILEIIVTRSSAAWAYSYNFRDASQQLASAARENRNAFLQLKRLCVENKSPQARADLLAKLTLLHMMKKPCLSL